MTEHQTKQVSWDYSPAMPEGVIRDTNTIIRNIPERSSEWILQLFGSSDLTYTQVQGYKPSYLVRVMCKYLLDCHWVRLEKPNNRSGQRGS